MSKDNSDFGRRESETRPGEDGLVPGRRKVLIAGALLVPTIATLHATPAWAQTDYTMTAYRYGTNEGLCRNPNFNPHASQNSQNGQEFIECPVVGSDSDSSGATQTGPGPADF